jgi:hypothetical protein
VTSATFPERFIFDFALQSPTVFPQPSGNQRLQGFAEDRRVVVNVLLLGRR